MLLHIVARGKIGRTSEAELVERYLKRIAWPTRVSELPDRGGTPPPATSSSVTVLLDERGQADLLLSFGPATWPHMLARAMLAEQLFRATAILAGHPYHREG